MRRESFSASSGDSNLAVILRCKEDCAAGGGCDGEDEVMVEYMVWIAREGEKEACRSEMDGVLNFCSSSQCLDDG